MDPEIQDNLREVDVPYIFWRDESKQRKDEHGQLVAPVSIVFEDESGHSVMPDEFWTEATCKANNNLRGLNDAEVDRILISSMFKD